MSDESNQDTPLTEALRRLARLASERRSAWRREVRDGNGPDSCRRLAEEAEWLERAQDWLAQCTNEAGDSACTVHPTCENCGESCRPEQRYCGAACCAKAEGSR